MLACGSVSMRFEIDFLNPDSGQSKTMHVVLSSNEVAATRAYGHAYPELVLKAKALQVAYHAAGRGYRHVGPQGIRQTILN
jgi:hypothetical protein